MSDEIKPAESDQKPNEASDTLAVLPAIEPPLRETINEPPPKPFSYWAKRLLACNPFYLVSAAMLLFGLYRIAVDPNFFASESGQMLFNFTSLQFYELLLVGTAIVLARRRIWYDSTLLVVLENLFVLVPFILVSTATLIDQGMVQVLCLFAVLLAVGRCAAARRWISELRVSPGFLASGFVFLLVNTVLPIIYRHLHETKFGTKIAAGAAYEFNEVSWLWLLPLLCAMIGFLPRVQEEGKLTMQRRWFPVGLFILWLAGTGVHLYALGYVFDFDLRRELLAPALCVLAWVSCLRLGNFISAPPSSVCRTMLTLPMLTTLLAAGVEESSVFFILTAANAVVLSVVALLQRDNRTARQLLLLTSAIMVAAIPRDMAAPVMNEFSRGKFIGIAAATYLIVCAVLSKNPKIGLAGAFAAMVAGGMLRGEHADTFFWATQSGLVFLLLHSLRWEDHVEKGAAGVRIFIAGLWVLDSIIWVRTGASFWQPLLISSLVLAACITRRYFLKQWQPVVVPLAGALVALCSPVNFGVAQLQTTPVGIIAVIASFLLFAAGTGMALTKHHWHQSSE